MTYPVNINKIQSPAGMYQGVFANHYTDAEHLACFETMAGSRPAGHVDISLRFMNFKALGSGAEFFPTAEAERMRERGGALYLVLEPGSGRGSLDQSHSPREIIKGEYDKQLEEFAEEAADFGGPIFISFRAPHGAAYTPEEIRDAYIYIHNKLTTEGARNITWVWQVSLEDPNFAASYPDEEYVDWISVPLYQTDKTDALIGFDEKIKLLRKKSSKPIIVEFGSSAPPAIRAVFIRNAIARFQELGIKAFIINNVSQFKGPIWRSWTLGTEPERKAYQEAISAHEQFLKQNIITPAGEMEAKPVAAEEQLNCSEIEGHYYTPADAKRMEELRKIIKKKEEYLGTFFFGLIQKGDPHYNNNIRIELARAYQELFYLTNDEKHFKEARQVLDEALESPDLVLKYHWKEEFIREYFEILLDMVTYYAQRDSLLALKYSERVLDDLNKLEKESFINPLQIRRESISGFRNRAYFEQARIYLNLRRTAEAKSRFTEVITWARQEAPRSRLIHLWKDEKAKDIRYLQAKAAMGLAQIAIYEGDFTTALSYLREVLSLEESGKEDGFMNLGFTALIYSLWICLKSSQTLEEAKEKLRKVLPWEQIDRYPDLKHALECEEQNFTHPSTDLWETILRGLMDIDLASEMRSYLVEIQIFSEIQGEK